MPVHRGELFGVEFDFAEHAVDDLGDQLGPVGEVATTPPRELTLATARAGAMAGAVLVSVPLSFVTKYVFVCWLVLPILHGAGLHSLRRLGKL